MTKHDTILGNAVVVLADRVIERGWVAISDGRIAEFGEGDAPKGSIDAAFGGVAFAEFGDTAIGYRDPAALDHAIGQHDAGITEDGLVWCRSHLTSLPSCRGGKRCHVDDPVGDQMAYFVVMDDGDHRHALALLLRNQFDDDGAVGRVQ